MTSEKIFTEKILIEEILKFLDHIHETDPTPEVRGFAEYLRVKIVTIRNNITERKPE